MSFYAKSVSFWPNEWIFKYSDKIMSCKLWSKVTSVFLNINFVQKCQFWGKKKEFREKFWFFSNNCALLLKVNNLLENMLIFRKLWLFVHVQISLEYFFCWKIVILIPNMIYSVIFWKKCHFPSKIYISGGVISLW